MSKYCIKDSYVDFQSDKNLTLDKNRAHPYWDSSRELSSKYFQWDVYKYLSKYVKLNDVVVDIGCGCGYKLVNVIGKRTKNVIGIDQDLPIDYCKKNYTFGKWIVSDFESQINPFKSVSQVDYIICADVIEHLYEPDNLIKFIHSISTEKTKIILSTPDRDRLRGISCTTSTKPEHIREWNFEEFNMYIQKMNFIILEHFFQYPMRISVHNFLTYLKILKKQFFRGDGCKFKYNQVLICRKQY